MANSGINTAPQEKDKAASCGLRKCRTCGKPFKPFKNHPRYKECSDICAKIRHDSFLKLWKIKKKKHIKEYKKEYESRDPERWKKYKHDYCKIWRTLNKQRKKENDKKYQKEHIKRICELSEIRRRKCPGKDHEKTTLLRNFKTSVVPSVCKKIMAIKHLIDNNKVTQERLNSITEGKTYAAYL